MGAIDNAITWAVNIANDNRYTYGTPNPPPVPPYHMDCSYFVIHAWELGANVNCHGATYTDNMESCMTIDNTFISIPFDYSQAIRGDVFLRENGYAGHSIGHTVLYMGNGQIVHASTHHPDDPDRDILVTNYYANDYRVILRYNGGEPPPLDIYKTILSRWIRRRFNQL